VKLGLQLNGFDWEGGPTRFAATLIEIAQEADRVAEQVMRIPEPQMQLACACGGESLNRRRCGPEALPIAEQSQRPVAESRPVDEAKTVQSLISCRFIRNSSPFVLIEHSTVSEKEESQNWA
jgi:hypothetical protein